MHDAADDHLRPADTADGADGADTANAATTADMANEANMANVVDDPSRPRLRIDIVTIFPAYLEPLQLSIVGRGIDAGLVELHVHDLRDYTHDRHRTVDDTPYGGGPGMVMRPEPWGEALDEVIGSGVASGWADPVLLVTDPGGEVLRQSTVAELAGREWLIIACGRYEGIDSRVVDHFAERVEVREVSIGEYVLAGGEAAALAIVEAVVRLVPGVLGNPLSPAQDSYSGVGDDQAVEGRRYTRPPTWRGLEVPGVLRSGDHEAIAQYHRDQSAARTSARRRSEGVAD